MLRLNLKIKVIKFFIILTISIFLAINLVSIFIPINQTTVLVNYIVLEEGGTIQLFYKQEDQDFSEDYSFVSRVTQEGRNVFEIPQTNIDELRIDLDDISIFRIKSVEISKNGFTRIIDSENWSNYYKAQYDMESLFDDEDLISYKATGIDPYIVFRAGESLGSLRNNGQYYLVLCIGSVLCFLISWFITNRIEKKGGSKKEKVYLLIKYFCAIFVMIQVINIDLGIIKSVNERKQTEYMVYISGAESVRAPETLTCKFIVHGKELLTQQFMIDLSENLSGNIRYQITDLNGNIIIDAVESLDAVIKRYNRNWDAIVINCEHLNLKFGQEYQICMQIEQDVPINFIMNSSGDIQQRQTMRFVYGRLYIFVILIVSLILMIMICWICRYGFKPKIFLASATVLGIISCFVLTPCTVDDEYRHFLRVYDIVSSDTEAYNSYDFSEAKGNVIMESQGASLINVPYELNRLRLTDMDFNYDNISYDAEMNYQGCLDEVIRLVCESDTEKTGVVSIAATKSISVWAYLPQVILAFVGKCFGMNAVGVFYMARIGNMLFSVFIAYVCMRLLPNYKNIFLLLHFAPNAFWISVSCNRDSVVTSLALMCVVYVLYIKEKKKILNLKRIIIITVIFSILAIVKLPYTLLVSILFLLGPDNFLYIKNNWSRRIAQVGIVFVVFAISVVSYKINLNMETIKKIFIEHEQVETIKTENEEYVIEPEVTHFSYALDHPWKIIKVLWKRYKTVFTEDLYRAIAGYRYQGGEYYFLLAFLVLVFSSKILALGQRIYMLVVYMAIWFSIIIVGYTFMPPDYGLIWGVNPRYMLPLLPVLAMVICSGNEKTGWIVNAAAPIMVLGMAAMNIVSMVIIYY